MSEIDNAILKAHGSLIFELKDINSSLKKIHSEILELKEINSSLKEIRGELEWFQDRTFGSKIIDAADKLNELDWTVKSSTASMVLESLDEIKSKLARLDDIESKLER